MTILKPLLSPSLGKGSFGSLEREIPDFHLSPLGKHSGERERRGDKKTAFFLVTTPSLSSTWNSVLVPKRDDKELYCGEQEGTYDSFENVVPTS